MRARPMEIRYFFIGKDGHLRSGWRAAFFVAGAPGLVLAVASLWLREPARVVRDPLLACYRCHTSTSRS